MSRLGQETCDICYEPMETPTRTTCRHYYCLECLTTWLETNNTCPSCRTKLFDGPDIDESDDSDDEEDSSDEEDSEDEDEEEGMDIEAGNDQAAPAYGEIYGSNERDHSDYLNFYNAFRARAAAERHGPPFMGVEDAVRPDRQAVQEELSRITRTAVSQETAQRQQEELASRDIETLRSGYNLNPPLRLNPIAVTRLLLALVSKHQPLPQWFPEIPDWEVVYVFEWLASVSRWWFVRIEYNDPPSFATMSAYRRVLKGIDNRNEHQEWVERVSAFFFSVNRSDLSEVVEELKAEQGGVSLPPQQHVSLGLQV